LSRALGDFQFKKNSSLGPDAQIITADPEVTCHEIAEEDEFLIVACDGMSSFIFHTFLVTCVFSGIWDCLTSQQVVDFVRYQVSNGKELTEVGEMICDHCLAPDTNSAAEIGCDNMTLLIVAITHGRTKEEWIKWIKERVKNEYGYKTPGTPPRLYTESRLQNFRVRKEAKEERERLNNAQVNNQTSNSSSDDRGISYQSGKIVVSNSRTNEEISSGSSLSHYFVIILGFLSKLLKKVVFQ